MAEMFRLDGKVAVVTGGAGGLGEGMALALARQGANVVIASRNLPNCESLAQKISSDPQVKSKVVAFQVDVSDERSVAKLAEQVVARFGTVDILVNSHGVNFKRLPLDFPMNDWDAMFDINVKGTMITCKEFGKIMVEKKRGKIINLSSVRGIRGTDGGNVGYCASKGAVDMITRCLAAEWAPYKINVNAIAPSIIMTEMIKREVAPDRVEKLKAKIPLGRMGTTEESAALCVFLASSESDWITGQIIYIDGGLTAIA